MTAVRGRALDTLQQLWSMLHIDSNRNNYMLSNHMQIIQMESNKDALTRNECRSYYRKISSDVIGQC